MERDKQLIYRNSLSMQKASGVRKQPLSLKHTWRSLSSLKAGVTSEFSFYPSLCQPSIVFWEAVEKCLLTGEWTNLYQGSWKKPEYLFHPKYVLIWKLFWAEDNQEAAHARGALSSFTPLCLKNGYKLSLLKGTLDSYQPRDGTREICKKKHC